MRSFRLAASLIGSGLILAMSGCADPAVFSEVLQQKIDDKVYTKYNIWYTDPENISDLNIQQGNFIPVGTEVEPIGTNRSGAIRFRDMAGQDYTINFDRGNRLGMMRDFINDTFTITPPEELLKDIPPKNLERVRRGEVVPGMSRKEVLLAYGPPPAIRTPDPKIDTWIYWLTPNETVRVLFRGDKVKEVWNTKE